jgi:glyoxylate utilization-related uncharacterized protein
MKISVILVDDAVNPDYQTVVTWNNGRSWIVTQDKRGKCETVRKNLVRVANGGGHDESDGRFR